ncbi:Manganese transporter smf1 [Lodderomyces elongisporus]|uniref:Manganese transporter smf1 n=1 Tax=Lodderomyces elongisporus TaxID=36914 RepID=UPI0029256CED|nr:Manganese transporter smf1 [Lodderomyces elongisporus]WLF79539.1 Manganese transporter smf1 [Lodderomyces elongisporus]
MKSIDIADQTTSHRAESILSATSGRDMPAISRVSTKRTSQHATLASPFTNTYTNSEIHSSTTNNTTGTFHSKFGSYASKTKSILKKYSKFIGPGLVVSVSYLDPGNYQTAITAGSSNKYSLLFIIFLSNVIAIFLQSLCIKLGSVTGYDLARCCREYLPKKLNYVLWILAECAIIATDVAEVIGSAIALNILIKVPLPAGVCITIVDVLFVMMTYRADTSSMRFVKIFEYTIGTLVMVVVICFAIQLSQIHADAKEIFRGFVPSKQMFDGNGMTVATSIVGATVMIHSLFLGSGLVQPRLREFDVKNGYVKLEEITSQDVEEKEKDKTSECNERTTSHNDDDNDCGDTSDVSGFSSSPVGVAVAASNIVSEKASNHKVSTYEKEASYFYNEYKPSYQSIKYSLKYSIIELTITLFTIALFVNAAILIVAGATLYGTQEAMDADLYTIHDLISKSIAPAMGTIFMVALLFSGQSAGIVCTIAGQVVSEGHINWTLRPWLRRLITRGISIVPCLIISLCIGRNGMGIALNISQVIISILLPPLTAPLIYFTCSKKIMRVKLGSSDQDESGVEVSDDDDNIEGGGEDHNNDARYKIMTNNWITSIIAVVIWIFVSVLNVYAIYEMAKNGVSG